MTEKIIFGSDPEFFFLENGEIIPPVFLWGEGKRIIWKSDFPYRVYEENEELAVTSDGAACELIVSPDKDWEKVFDRIQEGIRISSSMVESPDVELGIIPTAQIPERYLVDETVITGCDPDFDAFNEEWFAKETISNSSYRYAGAHIHIGFENKDMIEHVHRNIVPFVQLLSIFVGIPSFTMSSNKKLESLRTKKYGKPAKYRIPEHGVEYRSPSNNWIKNKELAGILFENVRKVVELFKNQEKASKIINNFADNTVFGFNTENREVLQETYENALKLI